jgi:hypothetical protein
MLRLERNSAKVEDGRPLVKMSANWVGGEVDGADVVAVDQRAPGEGTVELDEELPEPRSLRHAVGHDAVLRLGTRAGDDRLALRRLGHQVTA